MTRNVYLVALLVTVCSNDASSQEILLRVKVGNDTVLINKQGIVELAALQNDVSFEFTPLSDSLVRYAYKLEGYDTSWLSTKYPVTRYTNLSGGAYQFRVRELKGDKILQSESITVSVEKELKEEWWFIPSVIIYVTILISAAIYFFLLYNLRQKLKLQSMRYKIASDLHDEVGATLSSIAISTRLVQNKVGRANPDIQPILDRIKSDSEETIHTIRDTVWAINPDNDAPEKLFEKMRSFALQLFSALDIALDFDNQIRPENKLKISMEQRRNVFLLFKEAVNNIAKHSCSTKVGVSIVSGNGGLKLTIEDNGIGFDTAEQYEGNGLKSFRNRAQEGFMDLSVVSAVGKGTRIEVVVPEI